MLKQRPPSFRDEVKRELQAVFPKLRFYEHHIDELAHWLKQFERWPETGMEYWQDQLKILRANKAACHTVIALLRRRRSQFELAIADVEQVVAAIDADIAWLEGFLGHGTKPRRPWAIMAQKIGPPTLEALRGADQLAKREPRRGYGGHDGPVVRFVRARLAPLCQQTGDALPGLRTLHDVLTGRS
jgi:hypothetical protein